MRYWTLCHNWQIRNAFAFYGRHGVKAYLQNMAIITIVEGGTSITIFFIGVRRKLFPRWSICLLAIQHVPLPL